MNHLTYFGNQVDNYKTLPSGRVHVFPMADARFSWLQRTVQAILPVEATCERVFSLFRCQERLVWKAEKWTQLLQEEKAQKAGDMRRLQTKQNS